MINHSEIHDDLRIDLAKGNESNLEVLRRQRHQELHKEIERAHQTGVGVESEDTHVQVASAEHSAQHGHANRASFQPRYIFHFIIYYLQYN